MDEKHRDVRPRHRGTRNFSALPGRAFARRADALLIIRAKGQAASLSRSGRSTRKAKSPTSGLFDRDEGAPLR
jgi:hypothetical protein